MIEYGLGLLAVNSLLLLWFFSPLKVTLSELIFHETLMPDEFDDAVYEYNETLGKLCSCWICLSFWLSLIVGTIIGSSILWGLLCFFTYPCICYLFYITIKQSH